ncbi:PRA1 family protein E-like [Ananas comosus]|uniref:PRA1 family protein n=1 Tax=Ananas comosus TaxID=4615 RepID=A0A6P5FFJ8_ANACO|nr:PRA1 family protein E-like [Ananas comosus]
MRNAPPASTAVYGTVRAAAAPPSPRASAPAYGSIPIPNPTSWAPASSSPSPSGYVKIPAAAAAAAGPPQAHLPPGAAPLPSPATRVADLVARIKEQGQALIAARRPWQEALHAAAFSRPSNVGEATARIRRNAAYFRANYAIAILVVLLLGLLWHPFSMISLVALLAAWLFLYFYRTGPLVLLGRTFDDGTVLAALSGVTVVALLFTDVGWNVIGSILVGVAIVGVHAAFRSTDDLFLDEQEAAGGGFIPGMVAPVLPAYARIV